MERFIRQKYEQRAFMNESRPGTRSNTGSTSSAEDRPPPLPPKPSKRFGFGIQKSSTFPKNATPPVSPGLGSFGGHDASPPRVNKASRVFGSNVNTSGDGLESKLATLRDMGFPDDKRNSTVLKGLNGNLDRTVEALIRLGEQNPVKSRGNTPTPPAKPGVNGLTFDRTQTAPAATTSTNPFDALDAVAPPPQVAPIQTQQLPYAASTQALSPSNPFHSFAAQPLGGQYQQQQNFAPQQNHFGQQPQNLEQSFQGLQLSNQQTQQPLFPNRTGGYGQHQPPPFVQTNPFHQSFTPPPMPQISQQYSSLYQPQQFQSLPSPTSPGNPFLKSTRSQMFSPSTTLESNPFSQPASQQQPFSVSTTPGTQPVPNPFTMQQQPQAQTQAVNPFLAQQPRYQQAAYQQPQSTFDKNSILALYNYPQLAPQRPEQTQTPPAPAQPQAPAPTAPAPGHMNPFASAQGQQAAQHPVAAVAAPNPGPRHVSNESVDFAGLMGGRHSPDAFSGLSSSFRR